MTGLSLAWGGMGRRKGERIQGLGFLKRHVLTLHLCLFSLVCTLEVQTFLLSD